MKFNGAGDSMWHQQYRGLTGRGGQTQSCLNEDLPHTRTSLKRTFILHEQV
ncbi:hypothetical protein JOB18_034380 [Solea senegalensis]|uniref:Uncharacterized protein n=1 Tax=Solea senegalensis TaxID=28829 RepID=A0AAV6S1E3_SOLSE|nr:hypothetical protein JOB18_034380 [Solea senegalensis]